MNMTADSDKVNLVAIIPEISSFEITQEIPKNGRANNKVENVYAKTTARIDAAAEERQRTGRFLAVGITLVMVFIALYHTVMRHASVLAGLLAPAVIMLLYILWLLYFAKKRKPEYFAITTIVWETHLGIYQELQVFSFLGSCSGSGVKTR